MMQLLTSKLSGVRFCCFHGEKHKNCSYFKVTRTLTEPILLWTAAIGIHANSCLLKPVHVYSDMYQCEPDLNVQTCGIEIAAGLLKFVQEMELSGMG